MLNQRIFDYFNGIAEKIACEHRITATGINASDIGFNREIIVEKFLSNHIPDRLKVYQGGHIFGMGDQAESKQIDLVLANDTGINFREHSKMFTPIENVAAAFSIKSTLNKKELIDSLENIASIPQISKETIEFKFIDKDKKLFNDFIKMYPVFFVFAFKGQSIQNTLRTLESFYLNNPIPLNRRPSKIIVNNKYYISFTPNQIQTAGGSIIKPYTFYPVPIKKEISGIPYFNMLNDIFQYTDWLSRMTIRYNPYSDSFLSALYKSAT